MSKRKQGWIVPAGEKLAMVFGAGSYQALNTFVLSFLSIYLLMVGISPEIAAAVLLFLKAWDAINDMLFGFFVDKYRFRPGKNRFTAWLFGGRYMPWFRLMFLLLPIGTMVMFTINTNLPLWLRVAQYVLGYLLFDTGMTITGAYTLLPLSVTNNMDERNFVLSWNGLGQGFGSLPVVFLGTVFVAGSLGYAGSAVIFSILGLLLALIPAIFVKERNAGNYDVAAAEKYTVKEMLRALKQVPELILLLIGVFCWGLFYTSGYGLFVSYYIFGDANLSIILTLFSVIPSIVLVPFLPIIFRHLDKIVVARIACIVYVVSGIIIYGLGADFFIGNIGVLCILSLFQSTAYVMVMFAGSQMLVDLVEIAKFRTKKDVGGVVSASYNFVTKLVGSLVTSVSLLILSAYGFVSVEADSFEKLAELNAQGIGLQTDRALQGLWDVSYLFPMFGFAMAAVFFFLVKVKRKKVAVYMQANSGEITREEAETLLAQIK